ncbi:Fic family protein [Flavonifractor plautii]|uniref:Fic family protein n=1 Tax=Flavonifractor plautii TaxID=292800 RepID=UPI00233121A9|nr:Fic family protein [Flavonifractor plautii]MDB7957770.1 Fic family protein [Flavonifractor plautii]
MENRAGYFKSNLSGDMAYQSFVPAPLPPVPPVDLGNEGLNLLIQANRQLALLEGLAARIPNMDLFVSMYVRKEALLSSQIEGTQATLDDVLDPLLDENANRNVADVINYIKASEFAIKRLQELPLCNRLIKETHAVLMEGVRGQEKNPGEFRYSQNWIGGQGSTLKNARYIPPNPEDMKDAISDLEKYMNAEDSLDPLVRAALIHYQFETIHPFLDGNGRVGRLLITLFLMEKKILTTPALYISYFLKRNRIEYYDRMTEVRRKGNYEQWITFFLQAVMESAEDAVHTIDQLTALHDKNMTLLMEGVAKRQSDTLKKLFAYLEANPIIEVKKTSQALEMAYNTIARAVAVLVEKGILVQSEKAGKTRIYSYSEYLDILRKDT